MGDRLSDGEEGKGLRTVCLARNPANILIMTLGFFLLFTAFNTTQVPVVLCPHTASPPLSVPVLRCQAPTRRSRRKFFSRIVRHPLPPQQTVTIWNSCAGTPCSVSRPSWRPPASASSASNVRFIHHSASKYCNTFQAACSSALSDTSRAAPLYHFHWFSV